MLSGRFETAHAPPIPIIATIATSDRLRAAIARRLPTLAQRLAGLARRSRASPKTGTAPAAVDRAFGITGTGGAAADLMTVDVALGFARPRGFGSAFGLVGLVGRGCSTILSSRHVQGSSSASKTGRGRRSRIAIAPATSATVS